MEIAVDTARGLAYLHAKKNGAIIHRYPVITTRSPSTSFSWLSLSLLKLAVVFCRDLKPGNLMIAGSQYHSR